MVQQILDFSALSAFYYLKYLPEFLAAPLSSKAVGPTVHFLCRYNFSLFSSSYKHVYKNWCGVYVHNSMYFFLADPHFQHFYLTESGQFKM